MTESSDDVRHRTRSRRISDAKTARISDATAGRIPDATAARISDATAARIPDATAARIPDATAARIPDATVARLPVYLRALHTLADVGQATVSSEELATFTGVNSAKLRKDLSHLGSYGIRGVGYEVALLVESIARALGLTQRWAVVLVGVGNLGHALAGYSGFASRGFRIAALLDADPARVGERLQGLAVRHIDDLPALVAEHSVSIGVIATPASAAQDVCDRLVAAGVTSILNFAPYVLTVPAGVDVRKVDLSIELQILSFHERRKAALIDLPAPAKNAYHQAVAP